MKILVTGASGFLGSHLCQKLEEEGHELVKLNSQVCNLRQQGNLEKYLATHEKSFDQLYHLAAWSQAGDYNLYHMGEMWIFNQQINTNVLAYWYEHQPQAKMICMGTSCSYDPAYELSEENYLKGTPIDSLFYYAMTKRMLYTGVTALSKQYGMKYVCFVPSTLYGPGYHTDARQMHFIFDLIRKIMRGKLYGEPVVLWGDGYQKRELVYVKDFVRIMSKLAKERENELLNIGAGGEYTIRHFANLICEKVGYDHSKIEYDTSRYVGARSKCLKIDKIKEIMPEYDLVPLDQGLSETVDWFWANKDKVLPKKV